MIVGPERMASIPVVDLALRDVQPRGLGTADRWTDTAAEFRKWMVS